MLPGPASGSGPCASNCAGQVLFQVDPAQGLERQAFNATLGIAPAMPLLNVHASFVILDANHQDASAQFTFIVASDPQGAATGGAVSTSGQLRWQLVPKAGAGGINGLQYSVAATMSYTLAGQNFSVTTNAISITIAPQPQLQVTYSVPFVIVANKNAKIGVTVRNNGGELAHNFSVSNAQPVILSNPGNLPVGFGITGLSSAANGSTFQAGVHTIGFGDVQAGSTVAGYFQLQAAGRGFLVNAMATLSEQDDNGAPLELANRSAVGDLCSRRRGQRHRDGRGV